MSPTSNDDNAHDNSGDYSGSDYSYDDLVHRLPRAELVERIAWIRERCRGRRVIHVGFADAGFRDTQARSGRWLHGHLSEVAADLVGLDADPEGVAAARNAGYAAHLVDCTDPAAVAALGLDAAELVLAGEVIEHVDAPGPFLDGLATLCRPDGQLIVTTPNALGLVNVAAGLLGGVELNHPDHLMMFTWRTLSELLRRHGWRPVEAATYVPAVRTRGSSSRLESTAVRAVLAAERLLGRLGRPFSADGLIIVAEPEPRA